MDKIYIVGGLNGKAFPTRDLAESYAQAHHSIVEMEFVETVTPVEKISGCILFFNIDGAFKVQKYEFNSLDDKPKVMLNVGYGQYRWKLYLPLSTKDVKNHTSNILSYTTSALKNRERFEVWNTTDSFIIEFHKHIENIIQNGETAVARALLST